MSCLMIRAPHGKGNGQACPRTVELVDLYPTLADLCGLTAAVITAKAQVCARCWRNPKAAWKLPAFTQVTRKGGIMGRSIRTEQWRYTEWAGGAKGRELYDQNADPQEYRNLANDPKYASTVAELSARLVKDPSPVSKDTMK